MARREKPWWMCLEPVKVDEPTEWGVFVWESENMYRRENAVRVYKRRHAAEHYADTHDGNLVVRGIQG